MSNSWQDVFRGYLAQGYSPAAAAAWTGVTGYESNYTWGTGSYGAQPSENGGVLNPVGAYGISQWNGPRQADLLSYAQSTGADPNSLATQQLFQSAELNFVPAYQPALNATNSGTDPNAIASAVVQSYERPANPTTETAGVQDWISQHWSQMQSIAANDPNVTNYQSASVNQIPGVVNSPTGYAWPNGDTSSPNYDPTLSQGGPSPISTASWSDPNQPFQPSTSIGDQAYPTATAATQTIAGLWESTGATATSVAGAEQAKATTSAANSLAKALTNAFKSLTGTANQDASLSAKTQTQNVNSAETTGTTWLEEIFQNTKDLFQRGFIGLLGIVLILGALMYLSRREEIAA